MMYFMVQVSLALEKIIYSNLGKFVNTDFLFAWFKDVFLDYS